MAIRQSDSRAIAAALASLGDAREPPEQRIALIQALGDVQASPAATIPALFELLKDKEPAAIKNAALLTLQKHQDGKIGAELVEIWPDLAQESQPMAVQILASRHTWAAELMEAIIEDRIPRELIDSDIVARLGRYQDEELQSKLDQHFPIATSSLSDHEARIEALADIVKQGQGSPLRGQTLYYGKASCGKCHRLFDKGEEVGPDLTPYNRADFSRMLLAVVNPNAEIREGYDAVTVLTDDGRVLSGLKIEQTDQVFVLRGTDGQDQTIPTSQIDEVVPSKTSLMPEGLLDSLTDEEIRDLFAFLSSTTPPL